MKRGDLVRIDTDELGYAYGDSSMSRKQETLKAIVLEDYTGDKLVKVYLPSLGEKRTYHASQVQLHKRAQRPKRPFLSRIDTNKTKSPSDESERND